MALSNSVNAGTNGVQTMINGVWTGSALTQHDVLVGAASSAITSVAPSATSGVPLISQGAAADPAFGTAVVGGGGTGAVTFTAFAPVIAGTTSTGAFQSASTGLATAGFVLTSTGNASLPTFQAAPGAGSALTWSINATASFSLTAGSGILATNSGAIAVALPTSGCPVGSKLGLSLVTSGGVATITLGTGQTIQIGSVTYSTSVASTALGDGMELVTTVAASGSAGAWIAVPGVQGTFSGT